MKINKVLLFLVLSSFSMMARAGNPILWAHGADSLHLSNYYVSLPVEDGNYRVTVVLGSNKRAASTTIRGESRRMFLDNVKTERGHFTARTFYINKRSPRINDKDVVRIKERERNKLNWDDLLTIEVTGDNPAISTICIERDTIVPTLFLCGNSTVVDQDEEPWCSWGQIITQWVSDSLAVCNLAESGETASTFIQVGRLAKGLSMMKPGDYILMEFGHNDQKQKFAGAGAYYNFATALKTYVDEARRRGATPIFVTPTQRRFFDAEGHIQETHADYPEAMQWVAQREGVALIDLHQMTRELFETLGVEGSKAAFVHYPANTYPGQDKALADNTHFNPYGATQIARCILQDIRDQHLTLARYISAELPTYSPSHPQSPESFHWNDSQRVDIVKPDGN